MSNIGCTNSSGSSKTHPRCAHRSPPHFFDEQWQRSLGHLHLRPRHRGHLAALRSGGGAGGCRPARGACRRWPLRDGGSRRCAKASTRTARCATRARAERSLMRARNAGRRPRPLSVSSTPSSFQTKRNFSMPPGMPGISSKNNSWTASMAMVLAHHAGRPAGPDPAQGQRMEGSLSRDAGVPGNPPPAARHFRKKGSLAGKII